MGLLEQQNLLAKLYTDPAFSSEFMSDPVGIGSQAGLLPDEAREIAEISSLEIESFAGSLFWKRFREVKKLLPITSRVLGEEVQNQFRIFAAGFNPISIQKHLEDAIAFCQFVKGSSGIQPAARDAAKFELAKLRFFGLNRNFAFAVLRHDLNPPYLRRLSVTIWMRFRGNVHRFGA